MDHWISLRHPVHKITCLLASELEFEDDSYDPDEGVMGNDEKHTLTELLFDLSCTIEEELVIEI